MKQRLAYLTLLVRDYEEAIAFYTGKLNFTLIEDTALHDTKRWVVIKPPGSTGCGLLLAKATNEKQHLAIGNQTGGRVFLFLHTHNFNRDFDNLRSKNIKIVREPSIEPYGTVAVFEDLYGNLIDLVGPTN